MIMGSRHTHRVLRPFPASGSEVLAAGTLVNASTWRYTDLLVAQGYIEAINDDEPVEALSIEPEQKPKPWESNVAIPLEGEQRHHDDAK